MVTKKLKMIKELHTGSIRDITNKNEISLKNNVNITNQAKKVTFQLGFVRVKNKSKSKNNFFMWNKNVTKKKGRCNQKKKALYINKNQKFISKYT